MERTFILLKPDCVIRGLIGEILSKFEKKGLKVVGMKMVKLKRKQLEDFYSHHKEKPFFEKLIKFMKKTPVVTIILEGLNSVEVVRKMCGTTTGREAIPATVRGDYSMSTRMNIIHAADSVDMAKKEIDMFFKQREIYDYKKPQMSFIYCEEELEGEIKKRKFGKPRKIHKGEPPLSTD